jgi:nucleoside-diphosphate-sugar epimerase
MKIVITGANGTIGKIFAEYLSQHHEVVALNGRQDLDLLDRQAVAEFFIGKRYDVILHCAVMGANDVTDINPQIAHDNLVMFWNLYENYPGYTRFINIGSGVELGHGSNRKEVLLREQLPVLPYAMSKNLIARDVIKNFNFYNLRLFGVIANTRVFDKLHQAVEQGNTTFDVTDDKYMDYISTDDLCKIIKHYIEESHHLPNDINMVYETKLKVSEVLQRYITEKNLPVTLNVLNTVEGQDYTGDGYRLAQLRIL